MKTNYVALKEEDVKVLASLISEAEKKTLDYEFVLRQIRKELKQSNRDLAMRIDTNWKRFEQLHALQMPHIIYNGSSTPTICDWVKDPEGKFKLEKAVKAYRYVTDEEQTIVEGCFDGRITRSVEEAEKEIITYKSGFSKEVAALDEEGKVKMHDVDVVFVPKKKTTWGFTKVMVEAFMAAADDLLVELAAATEK